MGNLVFLVGAIALSVAGSIVLWLRHREPTSFMSSIDDFQREMTALSGHRPAGGIDPSRAPVGPMRPDTPRGTPRRGVPGRRASRSVRRPIVPASPAPGLAEDLAASRRRAKGASGQDLR
jgi:hypothetical protein